MDLKSIITAQIEKTNQEIEAAKAEAKKRRKAAKEEILIKDNEILFNYQKEKIEGSGIREILEIIVEGLNSSDEKFSKLRRNRVINQILTGQDTTVSILGSGPLIISQPCLFEGDCSYEIEVYYYDRVNYLFRNSFLKVYYYDNKSTAPLIITVYVSRYSGSRKLPLNKELAAKQIVDFLMKVQ